MRADIGLRSLALIEFSACPVASCEGVIVIGMGVAPFFHHCLNSARKNESFACVWVHAESSVHVVQSLFDLCAVRVCVVAMVCHAGFQIRRTFASALFVIANWLPAVVEMHKQKAW